MQEGSQGIITNKVRPWFCFMAINIQLGSQLWKLAIEKNQVFLQRNQETNNKIRLVWDFINEL